MALRASLAQLFAVCVLSSAVRAAVGEDALGVRAVCGLSIALCVLRLAASILGQGYA